MKIEDVKIDKDFHKLCPALSSEELNQLKENILNDGAFLDPVIAWESEGILLDGHNRLDVWGTLNAEQRKKIAPPEVKLMDFKTRAAAHNWIINNQLGRRNLSAKQRDYLIGQWFNDEKKNKADNLKKGKKPLNSPKGHNVTSGDTAGAIAEKTGKTSRQVKRDANFNEAVEALIENIGPEVKNEILNDSRITKKRVMEIAELPAAKQKAEYERAMGRGEPSGGDTFNPEEWGGYDTAEEPIVASDVVTEHHLKEMQAPYREVQKHMTAVKKAIEKLPDGPGGPWCGPNQMQDIMACFNNLKATVNQRKPVAICGHCNGAKCDQCYQTGVLNKDLSQAFKEGTVATGT